MNIDEALSEELHNLVIKILKRRKGHSRFKDNFWQQIKLINIDYASRMFLPNMLKLNL